MSLLQDPYKSLRQIEWYLDKKEEEKFPGALFLAAGNLCRQTIEQIIFIIAFYSDMPQNKYLNSNFQLKNLGQIINELNDIDKSSGISYIKKAGLRSKRIQKFVQFPKFLDNWRRIFNEPSHYNNPVNDRKINKKNISSFVNKLKFIIDEYDMHLITAAVNEIKSNGEVKAIISNDEKCTPCIHYKVIITPKNIILNNGKLVLKGPEQSFYVIPDTHEIPTKRIKKPILVQHSCGIGISTELITKNGIPVILTNFKTIIESFTKDKNDFRDLTKRSDELGIKYEINIE
jgi:hypothetical protein